MKVSSIKILNELANLTLSKFFIDTKKIFSVIISLIVCASLKVLKKYFSKAKKSEASLSFLYLKCEKEKQTNFSLTVMFA